MSDIGFMWMISDTQIFLNSGEKCFFDSFFLLIFAGYQYFTKL